MSLFLSFCLKFNIFFFKIEKKYVNIIIKNFEWFENFIFSFLDLFIYLFIYFFYVEPPAWNLGKQILPSSLNSLILTKNLPCPAYVTSSCMVQSKHGCLENPVRPDDRKLSTWCNGYVSREKAKGATVSQSFFLSANNPRVRRNPRKKDTPSGVVPIKGTLK